MEDEAMDAYAGWPERLFIIVPDGTLAYEGGQGPMDFDPDEVEDWLRLYVEAKSESASE